MELFSTPVFTFRTSENQENTMKKSGPAKTLQRKPFLDRPINSKTPTTDKLSKGALPLKKNNSPLKESDLDDYNYMFSFEDKEDNECDVWPKPTQLGTDGILRILHNYCSINQTTPPPSPINKSIDIDFMFTKLPKNMDYYRKEDVLFESISDMEIPSIEEATSCF